MIVWAIVDNHVEFVLTVVSWITRQKRFLFKFLVTQSRKLFLPIFVWQYFVDVPLMLPTSIVIIKRLLTSQISSNIVLEAIKILGDGELFYSFSITSSDMTLTQTILTTMTVMKNQSLNPHPRLPAKPLKKRPKPAKKAQQRIIRNMPML